MGLRKGEVLGLAWDLTDFDDADLYVGEQVQRVGHQPHRRQVKTETSEAPLPLIDCLHRGAATRDALRKLGQWLGNCHPARLLH